MKRYLSIFAVIAYFLLNVQNIAAQAQEEDLPPNAELGKCYAKSSLPDKYDTVIEQIVEQPQSVKKVKVPATFKTVFDTIVSQPKSFKVVRTSEVYETIVEEVMTTPASYKWVKGKTDVACLSPNPKDCEVLVLVEIPPVYTKTEKKVLKEEAKIDTVELPAQFKVVPRKVVDTPEEIKDVFQPASYRAVKKSVLVEKGEKVWREVACADFLTRDKVIEIQKALISKGYPTGPADGIIGNMTRNALLKFQRDRGVAEGHLTLETLDLLGIR